MVLEYGDLASAEHGFEGQFNEELGGGGQEGAEGVGGGCEEGVDAQSRAEEERR